MAASGVEHTGEIKSPYCVPKLGSAGLPVLLKRTAQMKEPLHSFVQFLEINPEVMHYLIWNVMEHSAGQGFFLPEHPGHAPNAALARNQTNVAHFQAGGGQ